MQLQQTRRSLPCGPLTTFPHFQLLPPSKARGRKNPRGKQACSSWPMVSFLSNSLCLKSSFQFEGPEIEGPDMVAERSEAIRFAPSSFRACTPKMKTPSLFFYFLFFSSKETKVPAPQRSSNGASRPNPTRRPNTCRAPSRPTAARSAPEASGPAHTVAGDRGDPGHPPRRLRHLGPPHRLGRAGRAGQDRRMPLT